MTASPTPYAAARVRAMRSRLLGPEAAPGLRGERGLQATRQLLAELGLPVDDVRAAWRAAWRRHGERMHRLIRLHPGAEGPFVALLGRLETTNLLVAWRGCARGLPAADWVALWRPLGPSARLDPERLGAPTTLGALVDALAGTAWAGDAASALRAHGDDPPAAELALARGARRRLLGEARTLARRHPRTAELLQLVVVGDEVETLQAVVRGHTLGPQAALALVERVPERLGRARALALARWRPGEGEPPELPPRDFGAAGAARSPEALGRALAENRRRRALHAFVAGGMGLSPAVALAVLSEAEAGAVVAALEAGGGAPGRPSLDRALAASAAAPLEAPPRAPPPRAPSRAPRPD